MGLRDDGEKAQPTESNGTARPSAVLRCGLAGRLSDFRTGGWFARKPLPSDAAVDAFDQASSPGDGVGRGRVRSPQPFSFGRDDRILRFEKSQGHVHHYILKALDLLLARYLPTEPGDLKAHCSKEKIDEVNVHHIAKGTDLCTLLKNPTNSC